MSFIFLAIPIIFVILFVTVLVVFSTDSKKYLKNLDTASQLKLEKLREEALDEVKMIKNKTSNIPSLEKKESLVEINIKQQKNFFDKKKLEDNKSTPRKYNVKVQENSYSDFMSNKTKNKISFNKEKIIRGIIAKEYFDKKVYRRK